MYDRSALGGAYCDAGRRRFPRIRTRAFARGAAAGRRGRRTCHRGVRAPTAGGGLAGVKGTGLRGRRRGE
eukprot:9471814-Pyramimonas_sp.AAC.1